VLRSGSPEPTEQEIWGCLRARYALSALICAAATSAGIDPDRVRIRRTVRIARRAAGPAVPPEHSQHLLAQVKADITSPRHLNPARRHRTWPRAIKRGRHNAYRVRKPGDKTSATTAPLPSGSPTP
jgi:hypothetical protein